MTIALFTDTYPPHINGVATSTDNLAKILRAHGHRVIVVTTRYDKGPLEIKDDVIRFSGIILKSLYGYTLSGVYSEKAMKYLKNAHLDLIHMQTDFMMGIFARTVARRLHVPMVYTYHTMYEDYTHYVSKDYALVDKSLKSFSRRYMRFNAKKMKAIICPSEKAHEYLTDLGVKTKMAIIPTGIDVNNPLPNPEEKKDIERFKMFHQYTEQTKTVLVLSRLAEEKSIDVSIRCFASYLRTHQGDYRLVIVGDGPDRKSLIDLVNELGIQRNTIFVGAVEHSLAREYYLLGDVFVTSSKSETQGLTLIESMAVRTPVLARHDEPTDALLVEGKNGYFFESEEEFAQKLDIIFNLDEKAKKEMDRAMLASLKPYSLETFYEKVNEVYLNAKK